MSNQLFLLERQTKVRSLFTEHNLMLLRAQPAKGKPARAPRAPKPKAVEYEMSEGAPGDALPLYPWCYII